MNNKPLIPALFYPLRVLFVDDNIDVIKSYNDTFSTKFNMSTTASAKEAIFLIDNGYEAKTQSITINENKKSNLTENHSSQSLLNILTNIYQRMNDKTLRNYYNILITDYDMPNLNGIELCNQISDASIIKILLTGKYDLSDAVRAMNDNIIDCYVSKGSDDTIEQITHLVTNLTLKYFLNLTKELCKSEYNQLKFLFDKNFAQLLNSKIKEHAITEYYLISETGSFLLINNSNKFAFVVYNKPQLNEFCEMFQSEPTLSKELQSIKNLQVIPFFGLGNSPEDISFDQWQNMLFAATQDGEYFWSLIPLEHIDK